MPWKKAAKEAIEITELKAVKCWAHMFLWEKPYRFKFYNVTPTNLIIFY